LKGFFRLGKAQIALKMWIDAVDTLLEGSAVADEYLDGAKGGGSRKTLLLKLNQDQDQDNESETAKKLEATRSEINKLKKHAKNKKDADQRGELKDDEVFDIKCIKTDGRKPQVKEFDFEKEVSEAKRSEASLDEDENSRYESREIATDGYIHY